MRAAEFTTEVINPKLALKDFYYEKKIELPNIGPLTLVAHGMDTSQPHQFMVTATDDKGNKVGNFRFVIIDYDPERRNIFGFKVGTKKDPYVIGGNVNVQYNYQKKGIATAVYKFVRELGNDIKPSTTQTAAGKNMWKAFNRDTVAGGVQ